jgi:hypothetical protein
LHQPGGFRPCTSSPALPSPRRSSDDPALAIEDYIGRQVAALVKVLTEAMAEWCQNGKLANETKYRFAELIAELVMIRLYWPDFDQVAKTHGLKALREYCATNLLELDDSWLTNRIEITLGVMTTISRKALC